MILNVYTLYFTTDFRYLLPGKKLVYSNRWPIFDNVPSLFPLSWQNTKVPIRGKEEEKEKCFLQTENCGGEGSFRGFVGKEKSSCGTKKWQKTKNGRKLACKSDEREMFAYRSRLADA